MSTNDHIRAMIKYNYALYRRVWESIAYLSDEQFVQEIDYSHGSIRNHVVHVATVDGRWLRGLQELPTARQFNLNPSDYVTRESARAAWEATAQDVADYVASLDDAGLERQPQGMYGPVWQVLAHMVNHGTDHRAQILRALHDLGAPTFDQDLILYLWRR
jgi:uncharacterized damage-inducible protein DinB